MSGPGNDERRPGRGGVTVEQANNHAENSASAASKDSATGCPTLHVELYRNTARLYGTRVVDLLDRADIRARQYDRGRRCWTIPINRADDVICLAEYSFKRFVTVSEVAS